MRKKRLKRRLNQLKENLNANMIKNLKSSNAERNILKSLGFVRKIIEVEWLAYTMKVKKYPNERANVL